MMKQPRNNQFWYVHENRKP